MWIRTTAVVLFAMCGAWRVANAAPVAKAKPIFDAQLAAIRANDEAVLAGTFSKDAIGTPTPSGGWQVVAAQYTAN